jgi:hypothetical protein
MIILFWVARWLLPITIPIIQNILLNLVFVLVTLAFAMLPMEITMKVIFLFMVLLIFIVYSWFAIIDTEERMIIQNRFKKNRIYSSLSINHNVKSITE